MVVRLADGEVTRVADVKSFQVPGKGGAWLAYLKEAKPEEKKPETKSGDEPKAETKAATPEETTRTWLSGAGSALRAWRSSSAAMGERQTLAVQTTLTSGGGSICKIKD